MSQPRRPVKTGLPRDVTKWLQSLELSTCPRNARRDFSSGYLVAEIFSRYYPQDFRVHSYDKGTSLSAKQRNWSHIARSLQKKILHLTKEVIDGAIHCKPGAAEQLVREVYTFLTKRSIPDVQAPDSDITDEQYQFVPTPTRCRASTATRSSGRPEVMRKETVTPPGHGAERRPHPELYSSSTWRGAAVSFKEVKVCQPVRRSLVKN